MEKEKIEELKIFFEKEPSVVMAFLFGSMGKGKEREISDCDIAVYFYPLEYMELEREE